VNGVLRDVVHTQTLPRRLLGTLAKLLKATISFVMSVRLSAWNNSAPTERIFMKLYI
jgi:hypothetical protein